jgi:hypothetical protein
MRRALPPAIAALCLALAGCGGGGDSSTSTATTTQTSTATTQADTTAKSAPKAKPKPETKQSQQQEQPKEPPPAPKPYSGPAPTDPNPLPNQGTKRVAPGVPTSHGGDNSVQRFGTEAGSSERIEATQVVQAYLTAQAQGRWSEACSYLTSKVRSGLEALADKAKGKAGSGCEGAMGALLGKVPEAALRKAAEIQVLSFRVQGDQGFVVYRDGEGTPYNLPLDREGGEWKVGALVGVGLVL